MGLSLCVVLKCFSVIPRTIPIILPITKAGRLVITSIFWFALVNWNSLLPEVDWDLSRCPNLWKSNRERSHGAIRQLFEHHGINPIRSYTFMSILLEQQKPLVPSYDPVTLMIPVIENQALD